MPVRVVPVDLMFGLALPLEAAWLWATGVLTGVRIRPLPLGAAAVLAALADVLSVFPAGKWLSLAPVRVGGLLGILLLAYGGVAGLRALPRLALTFVGVGVAMAGTVLLLGGGGSALVVPTSASHWQVYPVSNYKTYLIQLGVLLALAGGRLLLRALDAWHQLRRGLVEVVVDCGWGERRLQGLVDSGNLLRDPFSGEPVLVVSPSSLAGAVPAPLLAMAGKGPEAENPGAESPWRHRCRWVPYQAVGTEQGWLLALRPRRLLVGGQPARGLVAVGPTEVGTGGTYQALVPDRLLGAEPVRTGGCVTVGRGDEA